MFTGIVIATGRLVSLHKGNAPLLTLTADLDASVRVGDSVAVNGACLTAVTIKGKHYAFNLSGETLSRSHFSDLVPGSGLNLELPLTLQDFLGGHLVSGHLDGTARLRSRRKGRGSEGLTFTYGERDWRRFLLEKGSVTLNGVSLTLTRVENALFSVEAIPQTLKTTNLGHLRAGERVNVELDLLGKYLYNFTLRGNNHDK